MSEHKSHISPIAVCLTFAIFICTGIGHRWLLAQIDASLGESLALLRPLTTFPLKVGPWEGRDVVMDEQALRVAGDDDYLKREYNDNKGGRSIGLYVGYVGRPRSAKYRSNSHE